MALHQTASSYLGKATTRNLRQWILWTKYNRVKYFSSFFPNNYICGTQKRKTALNKVRRSLEKNNPVHCSCSHSNIFMRKFCISNQKIDWVWNETRFNGIILDLEKIMEKQDKEKFVTGLTEYLSHWKTEGKRGVWVRVPLLHSWAIEHLYECGFSCHHAKNDYIMMKIWLPENEEDKMPGYAFHTVGVSGVVLNQDKSEALVVQDKGKITKWKFPGGFSEPNEDIGDTAVREVREETGIESEFQSVLAFRQQHNMWFGQSDLYIICRLHPLTHDINICQNEIAKCEWLPVEYLLRSEDSTPLTKRVSSLILQGMENGFEDIDILPERMQSWVPPYDKTFQVFHRPIKL